MNLSSKPSRGDGKLPPLQEMFVFGIREVKQFKLSRGGIRITL